MSKRESLSRYNLIVKRLRKKPSAFNEIADYLSRESELQGYNFNISKRTFQRDVEDIFSLYQIEIRFDFSRRVYFIDSDGEPEANERMLEAFDTFNALNIADRLSKYIHFEKRRPQGTENLYGLLHAIKNRLIISFSYQKFWEDEPSERNVEPRALKEFKNRWYLMAKDQGDKKIKTFALDRMSLLDISKKKFVVDDNFDVADYFKYCFGIIGPDKEKPEVVILSFDPFQGKYIKTLPLHETQEVLVDTAEELRIKLKIYITHDFLMEILAHGERVKVLKPKSLADQVKNELEKAIRLY